MNKITIEMKLMN